MSNNPRIPLTDEMKERLRELCSRTGWSGSSLFNAYLRDHRFAKSNRLSAAMINNWLYGQTMSVERGVFDCVVKAFENLPEERWGDAKGRTINRNRTELTPEVITKIKFLKSSYPPLALRMELSESGLKGLTPALISGLLQGQHKSILTSHLKYIEALLAKRALEK